MLLDLVQEIFIQNTILLFWKLYVISYTIYAEKLNKGHKAYAYNVCGMSTILYKKIILKNR